MYNYVLLNEYFFSHKRHAIRLRVIKLLLTSMYIRQFMEGRVVFLVQKYFNMANLKEGGHENPHGHSRGVGTYTDARTGPHKVLGKSYKKYFWG